MVNLPEAVLIKRIDFPSPSNHQWLMVRLLVVGTAEPLVLHAGMLTGLSLYRSCIDNQSCCKPMSAATLSYPRDAVVVPPNFWLSSSIHPLFHGVLGVLVERVCDRAPFMFEHGTGSCFCPSANCVYLC